MLVSTAVKALLAKCGISAFPEGSDSDINLAPWITWSIDLAEPYSPQFVVGPGITGTTSSLQGSVTRTNQVGGESQFQVLGPGIWRIKGNISCSRTVLAAGAELTDTYSLDIMDPNSARTSLVRVTLATVNEISVPFDFTLGLRGLDGQGWTLIARAPGSTGAGLQSRIECSGVMFRLLGR